MAAPNSKLLKVLGVAFGVAILVGNTIGTGILRTPGEVAAALPSAPWFIGVWVAGGVYAMLGAMTLAELAVMIPKSGGQYVFARRAMGEYVGFLIGWTDWVSSSAASAFGALALSELAGQVWPSLATHGSAVAAAVVFTLTAVQWIGARTSDRSQQLLSALKVTALLGVALFALAGPGAPAATAPAAAFPSGFAFAGVLVVVFQSVLYTYDGWNGVSYFGGEIKDPGRETPRAMLIGVVTVLVVYLALNAAFIHVLGIAGLAGEKFPAAATAKAVFGANGESIVRAVIAVTLLGGVNAILMISSRIPFAMAEDGLLPRSVTAVNRGGTPHFALAASSAMLLLLVLTSSVDRVLALSAFFYVLQYAVSFASLFVLRRTEPDTPRAYRAWGYPWIPGLVLVGALAFLISSFFGDRENSLKSLVVIAASYPLYLLAKRMMRAVAP